MLRFILKRLLAMVLVLWAISVLVYLIFFETPGVDPAARIAGRGASPAVLDVTLVVPGGTPSKGLRIDEPQPTTCTQ